MLGADWDAEKGEHKTMIAYGDRFGEEHIHLFRNYRNYSEHKEYKGDLPSKVYLLKITVDTIEEDMSKLKSDLLFDNFSILKKKTTFDVLNSQRKATENIFKKKKIPFRSFEINNRDEEVLGELFSFFILETILLGKVMKLNPFDQPEVELIKKETKKILV